MYIVSKVHKRQEENISNSLPLSFQGTAEDNQNNQTTVSYLNKLKLQLQFCTAACLADFLTIELAGSTDNLHPHYNLHPHGSTMLQPTYYEYACTHAKKSASMRLKKSCRPRQSLVDYGNIKICLLYTSPSPRDRHRARMPSSA